MELTFEEAAVVRMYRSGSRDETITAMKTAAAYLDAEDEEPLDIRRLLDSAADKLSAMSERDFGTLNLTSPFDTEADADGG